MNGLALKPKSILLYLKHRNFSPSLRKKQNLFLSSSSARRIIKKAFMSDSNVRSLDLKFNNNLLKSVIKLTPLYALSFKLGVLATFKLHLKTGRILVVNCSSVFTISLCGMNTYLW